MKTETQDKIREKLTDRAEQGKFLSTCREFLDFIEGNCMGLSPGVSFFQQSAFGLRHLGSEMPRYKTLFEDAAKIYDTLIAKAPDSMYPPGGQLFDLAKVATVNEALGDAVDSEWEDVL